MTETYYAELDERVFRAVLPNGLTVAVVPRPGFSRKMAFLATDYGSIHTAFTLDGVLTVSPDGVAHYLEHKMFDLPGRDVSAEFAAMGADVNAFTSYDITAYHFTCTDHFRDCLSLLLEFVFTPYFTTESVEKEQGIIGQEIGMNDDSADTRVFENLTKAMYAEHPIRVPILGTRESIAQVTPEILHACHRALYAPANMMLCVVGDVDPDEVLEAAKAMSPTDPRPDVCKCTGLQEEMTCPQPLIEDEMDISMPTFDLGFKCEPAPDGEDGIRQEVVGDLAAEALFGESSPLYLRMYEEGLIDSSFGGGFETLSGVSMLNCGGDSEQPADVKEAILQEADRIAREGIPEEDFLRMKRSALGRRIRDLDSFESTCFRTCAYHFSQFDYFRFPAVYRQVEASELQEFLSRVVRPERCSLSIVYSLDKEEV